MPVPALSALELGVWREEGNPLIFYLSVAKEVKNVTLIMSNRSSFPVLCTQRMCDRRPSSSPLSAWMWVWSAGVLSGSQCPFPHGSLPCCKSEQGQGFTAVLAQELLCLIL